MKTIAKLVLSAQYDRSDRLYRARVKAKGDSSWNYTEGTGMSPDEARGHLLREMILAGLCDNGQCVILDIETLEDTLDE